MKYVGVKSMGSSVLTTKDSEDLSVTNLHNDDVNPHVKHQRRQSFEGQETKRFWEQFTKGGSSCTRADGGATETEVEDRFPKRYRRSNPRYRARAKCDKKKEDEKKGSSSESDAS